MQVSKQISWKWCYFSCLFSLNFVKSREFRIKKIGKTNPEKWKRGKKKAVAGWFVKQTLFTLPPAEYGPPKFDLLWPEYRAWPLNASFFLPSVQNDKILYFLINMIIYYYHWNALY